MFLHTMGLKRAQNNCRYPKYILQVRETTERPVMKEKLKPPRFISSFFTLKEKNNFFLVTVFLF